jgi:hypothetical protein
MLHALHVISDHLVNVLTKFWRKIMAIELSIKSEFVALVISIAITTFTSTSTITSTSGAAMMRTVFNFNFHEALVFARLAEDQDFRSVTIAMSTWADALFKESDVGFIAVWTILISENAHAHFFGFAFFTITIAPTNDDIAFRGGTIVLAFNDYFDFTLLSIGLSAGSGIVDWTSWIFHSWFGGFKPRRSSLSSDQKD